MSIKRIGILFAWILLIPSSLLAQWSGVYGNEWIDYSKSYLKIKVTKTGVHKIDRNQLPEEFSTVDPDHLQIWHRGRQIHVISANSSEIVFYGEINDGASDSLLYRPMSARLNPYVSFYSDTGAYFLTFDLKSKGDRVKIVDGTDVEGDVVKYHLQRLLHANKDQFAFTMQGVESSLNHSYFVEGNSWTGPSIAGPKARRTSTVKDTVYINSFQLINWAKETGIEPKMEIMVTGTNEGLHDIQLYMGKSELESDFTKLTSISFRGWGNRKLDKVISANMFSVNGKGWIKMFSTSTEFTDWSSLSYYKVVYPQWMDMSGFGATQPLFNFFVESSSTGTKRISISNPPIDMELYDITESNKPVFLKGNNLGDTFQVSVSQTIGNDSHLIGLNPTSYIPVTLEQITKVDFTPMYSTGAPVVNGQIDPGSYDYLIVTHDGLKEAALPYAQYRASLSGGEFRVLAMDIAQLYDQFNYGEPSPVAIRRFVDYMIKDGIRSKHNLLLLGPSVSYQKSLVKELPAEVPTFGDPGSDILLVAGLGGVNQDVPAIPVGRVNARSVENLNHYLSKVKTFENSKSIGWNKKVLHLTGGHSVGEIVQLKNVLEQLTPYVENSTFGGKVKQFVKTNPGEPEPVDISNDVNEGVGLITFFGHGSTNITDLDMGNVSDASRGYAENDKYSLMFFNGCGVGNIFLRQSPPTLADDWIFGKEKGAIAVFANSYYSYISSSQRHLNKMYQTLFNSTEELTIGQVLSSTAKLVLTESYGEFDVNNVHQLNLMGDPALILFKQTPPDYTISSSKDVFIRSSSTTEPIGKVDEVEIGVNIRNLGNYRSNDKIPVRILVESVGAEDVEYTQVINAIAYEDTIFFRHSLQNNPIKRILIRIDPDQSLNEQNIANNLKELIVDWSVAESQFTYYGKEIEDTISPILEVLFNGKGIQNNASFSSNPLISLLIHDERALIAQTSLASVYLKNCQDSSCEFTELDLTNTVITSISENSIRIDIPTVLKDGLYEFLAYVQDVSGNRTENGYRVSFSIENGNVNGLKAFVSPNPASTFVKLNLSSLRPDLINDLKLTILNLSGQVVFQKLMQLSELEKKNTDLELFWEATNSPRGQYVYQIECEGDSGFFETVSGKIILR